MKTTIFSYAFIIIAVLCSTCIASAQYYIPSQSGYPAASSSQTPKPSVSQTSKPQPTESYYATQSGTPVYQSSQSPSPRPTSSGTPVIPSQTPTVVTTLKPVITQAASATPSRPHASPTPRISSSHAPVSSRTPQPTPTDSRMPPSSPSQTPHPTPSLNEEVCEEEEDSTPEDFMTRIFFSSIGSICRLQDQLESSPQDADSLQREIDAKKSFLTRECQTAFINKCRENLGSYADPNPSTINSLCASMIEETLEKQCPAEEARAQCGPKYDEELIRCETLPRRQRPSCILTAISDYNNCMSNPLGEKGGPSYKKPLKQLKCKGALYCISSIFGSSK